MNRKLKIRVTIRSWDVMEKEFGLDNDGDIKCQEYFVKDMKNLCGKTITILPSSWDNGIYNTYNGKFHITKDMVI